MGQARYPKATSLTITATMTRAGLTVRCDLDPNSYPAGIKAADVSFDGINLQRHDVHGEWNDTISPRSDW